MRLRFPRVEQIIQEIGDDVTIDLDSVEPVVVSAENDPTSVYVEFEIGSPGRGLGGTTQDRALAYERFRMQRLYFRVAADIVEQLEKRWLFPSIMQLVQSVVEQRVVYADSVDPRELGNLRYINLLRERTIAGLRSAEYKSLIPVLNEYEPIGSTDCDFQTIKPCEATKKSHISHVVCDSKLEAEIAAVLEQSNHVASYAKNDRLFFDIPYRYLGASSRYRPDFIVQLDNGITLLLEGKGRKTEKDDAKLTATHRWLEAVNNWGELGRWEFALCRSTQEAQQAIDRQMEVVA
jgi:type III restriction enzyme